MCAPRIRHDGAGNCDALLLPAAQLRAALATQRVVAVWQRRHEGVRIGLACRCFDLLQNCIFLAVTDVFRDAAGSRIRTDFA